MTERKTSGARDDRRDAVDLTKLNADAAAAGAAACRQSNGPAREGGRLADARPAADK